MLLLKFLPCKLVDFIVVMLSKMKFGNLFKYGLERPKKGPFYFKAITGQTPTMDVGAMDKIRKGEIQVFIYFFPYKLMFLHIYMMANSFMQ